MSSSYLFSTAENFVLCTIIFERPNQSEIALESEQVTEQPKANTKAEEGRKEAKVAAGSGDKNEGGDADTKDSAGESEEEEEGSCYRCCHKANSLPIKLKLT